MEILRKRFPSRSEAFTVFGIVVFVVHSWSVRGFLYLLPSFLLDYGLGEIFSIFGYMMAFALFESLLVLSGLLALSLVLPVRWFREGFVYKSLLTVTVATISFIVIQSFLKDVVPTLQELALIASLSLLTWVGLLVLSHNFKPSQNVLFSIADRLSIMTYLYVPLGVTGFLTVLLRNLW